MTTMRHRPCVQGEVVSDRNRCQSVAIYAVSDRQSLSSKLQMDSAWPVALASELAALDRYDRQGGGEGRPR